MCVIILRYAVWNWCTMRSRVYQRVFDPVRVPHQVLDAFVHDLLRLLVEEALVERFDGLFVLFLPLRVLALLTLVLVAGCYRCGRPRVDRLGAFEVRWFPCTRVDTYHQSFKEGLDDVHHIRAEVPDHVEFVQDRQGRPVVDARGEARVVLSVPRMVCRFVGCFALGAGPSVCARGGWPPRAVVLAQGIIRVQPPRCIGICWDAHQ